jgi:hypothetical protein
MRVVSTNLTLSSICIVVSYHHGVTKEVSPVSFGHHAKTLLKESCTPAYIQFLKRVYGVLPIHASVPHSLLAQ